MDMVSFIFILFYVSFVFYRYIVLRIVTVCSLLCQISYSVLVNLPLGSRGRLPIRCVLGSDFGSGGYYKVVRYRNLYTFFLSCLITTNRGVSLFYMTLFSPLFNIFLIDDKKSCRRSTTVF